MARDHARLRTAIWSNTDFKALTGEAQRLYMLALSQPSVSFAGVVPFTLRRWSSLSADGCPDELLEGVDELQAARFVLLDDTTEELWIRTFVKNDGVLKSPNLIKRMVSDVGSILSDVIRDAFAWEWHGSFVELLSDKHRKDLAEDLETLPGNPSTDPWERVSTERVSLARARVARAAPAPTPAPTPTPNTLPPDGGDTDGESDADDPSTQLRIADARPQSDEVAETFDQWWKTYPPRNGKKVGKGKTLKLWRRLTADERQRALTGARNLAASTQLPRDPERFLRKDSAGEYPFDDWQTPTTDQAIPEDDPRRHDVPADLAAYGITRSIEQ
jgi:hypothetical protein